MKGKQIHGRNYIGCTRCKLCRCDLCLNIERLDEKKEKENQI